jgi:Flp pilus assembly protein TadG
MTNLPYRKSGIYKQRGVAVVEFALIATVFFIVLFAILEFGRLFYIFNSVQEVTRRAAREAVVRGHSKADQDEAINLALFGADSLPAGAMINTSKVKIEYLNRAMGPIATLPANNIEECLTVSNSCIAFVSVSISGATYDPMVGLFSGVEITTFPFNKNPIKIDFRVPIPASTVTMPAESMGYSG